MTMPFKERIEHFIESGFQTLYIPTAERSRCEAELAAVADKLAFTFVTWDGVAGFTVYRNGEVIDKIDKVDPIEALLTLEDSDNNIWGENQNILFVFRNLHQLLDEVPPVRQQFQNLYYGRKLSNVSYNRPIVIVANAKSIHPEISQCITLVEFQLPTEAELEKVFTETCACIEVNDEKSGVIMTYDDEVKSRVVQAMRGLTTLEAENNLAYSMRVNRGFGPSLVDTIEDQKAQTLGKSEVLTYVPRDRIVSMDDIGGYDELKDWINVRKLIYSNKARALKLDLPRGIVLLGVPGTGKSVVGKIIARSLGLPLVMMNVSAIYDSLVGASEGRIRSALNTIDALDGAVVLVDEAEKALGGANQASTGDSGVSKRVFGEILKWLTEKQSRTFVVMTMNRTRGIDAEFFRKGRFDEIFYTDIPTPEERDAILRIHCRKRDVETTAYPEAAWKQLITSTDNYVGAELEQIVCDARIIAFAARQTGQPTIEELLAAADTVVPIYEAERENINDIKKLCENRARAVSRAKKTTARKGRAVNIV
jgi:ATP-dependent 26S proteasome regulatory subunit